MKLYELPTELYDKWCESKQGKEFNEELKNFLYDATTPFELYNVILKAKEIFEREIEVVE
jgi:hypothetical protein